jgi:single-strand DNA-binding protein
MYLNKVILVGNLTRDPEKKALPSGATVTSFSLATNRVWIKDGNKQELTDYHNIVVFGRQADTSAQYLKKGQNVMVEGRIQTRSWDDASGKKNYRTEIVAERVQFGPKSGGSTGAPASGAEAPQEAPMDSGSQIDYPEDDINPEDIPF